MPDRIESSGNRSFLVIPAHSFAYAATQAPTCAYHMVVGADAVGAASYAVLVQLSAVDDLPCLCNIYKSTSAPFS